MTLIKTCADGTQSASLLTPALSVRKLQHIVDAMGREVNHTMNQMVFYIYDDGSVEKKNDTRLMM